MLDDNVSLHFRLCIGYESVEKKMEKKKKKSDYVIMLYYILSDLITLFDWQIWRFSRRNLHSGLELILNGTKDTSTHFRREFIGAHNNVSQEMKYSDF